MHDPIDVRRPRGLLALIADAATLLQRHLRLFALLAAAVVVPVDLIVSGIGLGQLFSGYDGSPPLGATVTEGLVASLVTTPLITAMFVTVVLDLAGGRAPDPRRAIRVALDLFAPLLLVVLLVLAGVVLGFFLLVLPGIILGLRWAVSAQAVVVEGRRGRQALARSWQLTRGRALYVLGVLVVSTILTALAGLVVSVPADALARSADLGIIVLGSTMLVNVFSLAYSALVSTLLYATLRAEHQEPLAPRTDAPGAGGDATRGGEPDAFGDPVAPWGPPAQAGADPGPGSVAPSGWEPPRPGS